MASTQQAKAVPDEGGQPGKLRPQLVASRLFALVRLMQKSGNIAYARELGLSEIEWATLLVIGDNAPLSLNALADLMDRNAGQISRSVAALDGKGFVSRKLSGYKHGMAITLTALGWEAFEQMKAIALFRNAQLTEGLSEPEVAALLCVLARIEINAAKLLGAERVGGRR